MRLVACLKHGRRQSEVYCLGGLKDEVRCTFHDVNGTILKTSSYFDTCSHYKPYHNVQSFWRFEARPALAATRTARHHARRSRRS